MNTALIVLGWLVFVVAVITGAVFALIAWMGSGESDVNGDPERDSGRTEDEIAGMSREWDRGSAKTERRPNLDYARRTNRNAMLRSAGYGS